MADTLPSETVNPEALETNATPPAAPVSPVNTVDSAEVERLKKEAEQAKMRAAQLENEKVERDKRDAEARQKQLEEKEEFKTLYEQERQKREQLESAQEAEKQQKALETTAQAILRDFPENVRALAATTGLSLLDDSDASKASFKEKLGQIQAQVGVVKAVPSNNPTAPMAPPTDREAREALVARQKPGAPSPMALASAKGDDSVFEGYVASLPAVERMREISREGA